MDKQIFYLAPDVEALFQSQGLANFENLWMASIDLVDEPNRDGEGWSEVGVLALKGEAQEEQVFYLKRQYNYHCRRLENPLQKIPEAVREWLNIQSLDELDIATMDVAVCARDCAKRSDRALFATRALTGYQDMGQWWESSHSIDDKNKALKAIGQLAAKLHNANYHHGCLYPKHVYISSDDASDVRLIDLEKCRRIFTRKGALRDLDTLLRRGHFLSTENAHYLLSVYREHTTSSWRQGELEKRLNVPVQSTVNPS